MKSKILLVEDDVNFYNCISLLLEDHDVDVVWCDQGLKAIQLYKQDPHSYAVVIIDYILPDLKGSEVCQLLRRTNQDQEFLFASGHSDPEFLTDQLETGASGFLRKGTDVSAIKNKILTCINRYNEKHRLISFTTSEQTLAEAALKNYGIIARSGVMAQMLQEIESAKNSPYPTMIIGETGTGKELVAKALVPERKKLISINCASFYQRENLLESELFGYVKGAFTGADKDTLGLVARANNQVLFLDELHQLPVAAQAKLLRFLQEMKFRRVGDNSEAEIKVQFKLICAVQPDIKNRIHEKSFLPDLYERVSTLLINVPPLKDRAEDIDLLVQFFQNQFNKDKVFREQKQFKISTIAEIKKHSWPSNIRGLQNAVFQMMTNCKNELVEPIDFKNYLSRSAISVNDIAPKDFENLQHSDEVESFETSKIISCLKKCKTRSEAALRMGLPLTTLMRKINKLGIDPSFYLLQ